jgi:hypothetical protein
MARLAQASCGVVLIWAVAACGGRVTSETSPAGTRSGAVDNMSVTGSSSGGSGAMASASGAVSAGVSGAVNAALPNQVINKIDMLFDIDNSASMGDKQQYLIAAIPDLIDGLVNPNCIDNATGAITGKSMQGTGCAAGSKPEFPAVRDMHIGIVSSSLGPRLSEIDPTFVTGVCNDPQQAQAPFESINAHMDDHAHLLTRSLTGVAPNLMEGAVADAAAGFLYWYPLANGMGVDGPPVGPATPLNSAMTLETDFTSLAAGVGVFGCGIESQMESWYRFLVQPDPYATLALDSGKLVSGQPTAEWVGVDSTIIQERHDFLRPDSLVAIVVLSDENDSEIDVRSLGGLGYFFMRTGFAPPHGTSVCATNPLSATCVSCSPGNDDPNCVAPGGGVAVYSAPNNWGEDLNLRHVHMRQKYGIDPQYPVERYFYGLTSPVVSDRTGEYPPGVAGYSGFGKNMNCTNPLFAASLPQQTDLSTTIASTILPSDAKTLCSLPTGTRTSDKVFFAHIGGVPHQLLHFLPGDPAGSTLTDADWVKILGIDPEHYNYDGIDPHMYESYTPRLPPPAGGGEGLVNPPQFDASGTTVLAPPDSSSNTDPVSGREWITDLPIGGHRLPVDVQFACTFPLATPRDCTRAVNGYACDCPSAPGTLTHDQTPADCSDATPTMQIAAKAYPTVRELLVAKMMGPQGVVSSICPIDVTDNAAGNDPLYGYRPAVNALTDHLKPALANACLPRQLNPVADGSVPCLILVTLPGAGSCTNPTCPAGVGLTVPASSVLNPWCEAAEASYTGEKGAPGDPALQSVCELAQLVKGQAPAADFDSNGSCAESTDKGWCYVQGAGASGCSQAIVFANGSPPTGSLTSLECSQ